MGEPELEGQKLSINLSNGLLKIFYTSTMLFTVTFFSFEVHPCSDWGPLKVSMKNIHIYSTLLS